MTIIHFAFMDKDVEVEMLGEKVAYSWTCGKADKVDHIHRIGCLTIWHNCDLNLKPVPEHWTHRYVGWQLAGVGLHDLISVDPLHIEASVFWPECCGMHGFIREGKWIDV